MASRNAENCQPHTLLCCQGVPTQLDYMQTHLDGLHKELLLDHFHPSLSGCQSHDHLVRNLLRSSPLP